MFNITHLVTYHLNGAQFLNATLVFASPPVVISLVTRIITKTSFDNFNLMLESFSFPSPYSKLI